MKQVEVSEEFQAEYFSKTLTLFNIANSKSPSSSEVDIVLAGLHIRLNFSSEQCKEHLLPALSHLLSIRLKDAVPEFTLCIWESTTTGTIMLPPPSDRGNFTDRGDIWGFNSLRYRFAFNYGEFSLNLFDREKKLGIFWVESPKNLPYWSTAAPLRTLLHWCMEMRDRQLLHAAAVGTEDGAVLLTGAGGSGKSTTALAGLCEGMDFAGDDYVVTQLHPEPRVYPIYSSAKVNNDNHDSFPFLNHLIVHEGNGLEKTIYQLYPDRKSQIPESMKLKGVLTPFVGKRGKTKIYAPRNNKEIQRAASFTTVSQLPYTGNATYTFIESLVEELPSFCIELGVDRKEIITTIKEFVKHPVSTETGLKNNAYSKTLPSLSVVVPVYNREKIIAETLKNITNQNYPELDIIVVNDGSEDNSEEAVLRFDGNVRYFKQHNVGPAQARNRGIINSMSDYIGFLDSDDLWPDNMLEYLVTELHNDKEADVVKGYAQLAYYNHSSEKVEFFGNPAACFPNYITGTVFRRSVFDKVGLFDKELRFGEDIDWFNRAGEINIKVKQLNCATIIVRRHSENMTEGKNLVELNVLKVFKKALDRKRTIEKAVKY